MSRAAAEGPGVEADLRRLCYLVSNNPPVTPNTPPSSPPLQAATSTTLTPITCSSEHDQDLDSLLVGPIPVGVNKFVFEADPPNTARIPATDILGVTVILLTCSYDEREFVRVGYYVNNEYTDEALANDPPAKPVLEKIRRSILAEKPRVTRFAIKWDSEESAPAEFPPEQPDVDAAEDDGATYGAEEEEEELEGEGEAPELIEGEQNAEVKKDGGEDMEMEGMDEKEDEEAGSEDLEEESEDEEDLEEEEGEDEVEGEANGGDHEMEMDREVKGEGAPQQHQADVMVH